MRLNRLAGQRMTKDGVIVIHAHASAPRSATAPTPSTG